MFMSNTLQAVATSPVRMKDTQDQVQMLEPTLKVEKSHETLFMADSLGLNTWERAVFYVSAGRKTSKSNKALNDRTAHA